MNTQQSLTSPPPPVVSNNGYPQQPSPVVLPIGSHFHPYSPVQQGVPPPSTVPPPTFVAPTVQPQQHTVPAPETMLDELSKKRKATEAVPSESPSKIPKINDTSVPSRATEAPPAVSQTVSQPAQPVAQTPPATQTAVSQQMPPVQPQHAQQPDEQPEECEIVWPEDAVVSKEDEMTFYERVVVNGVEYKLGDACELWPDESGAPGFIGTIKSLYTDGNENSVECCWFYRIEETIFKNNPRHQSGPRELYLSDHVDDNALESVRKKVTVLPHSQISNLAEFIANDDSYYYKRKYNHKQKCFDRQTY